MERPRGSIQPEEPKLPPRGRAGSLVETTTPTPGRRVKTVSLLEEKPLEGRAVDTPTLPGSVTPIRKDIGDKTATQVYSAVRTEGAVREDEKLPTTKEDVAQPEAPKKLTPTEQAEKLTIFTTNGHRFALTLDNFPDVPPVDLALARHTAASNQIEKIELAKRKAESDLAKERFEQLIKDLRKESDDELVKTLKEEGIGAATVPPDQIGQYS